MSSNSFSQRVDLWHKKIQNTIFKCSDYKDIMLNAKPYDFIYCDPPYKNSQSILYGSPNFKIEELINVIQECKLKNIYIALSVDGKKDNEYNKYIEQSIFKQKIDISCGKSMLKRFQNKGKKIKNKITDKLLLTY